MNLNRHQSIVCRQANLTAFSSNSDEFDLFQILKSKRNRYQNKDWKSKNSPIRNTTVRLFNSNVKSVLLYGS